MPKLIKWSKIYSNNVGLLRSIKELSMKTIEWNEGQRKAFQDLLREFVASIDAKVKERKQMGKTPTIPDTLHAKTD